VTKIDTMAMTKGLDFGNSPKVHLFPFFSTILTFLINDYKCVADIWSPSNSLLTPFTRRKMKAKD